MKYYGRSSKKKTSLLKKMTTNESQAKDNKTKNIRLNNLTKIYNRNTHQSVHAINDINMNILPGEFLTIVGPSGCGKSTLLDIIAGLTPKTSGSVKIGDMEVTKPRPEIGIVFQEYSLFPWRSILENVMFGLEITDAYENKQEERAKKFLELVGLEEFEDAYPEELSGGMQQRVALARTLAVDPDILLMDEPFGALDEQTRMYMGEELLRIWSKTDKTIVFVTHSLQESVLLSDRVAVMSDRPGEIIDIIDVDLERPRTTDMIGTESFNTLQSKIWNIVKNKSSSNSP